MDDKTRNFYKPDWEWLGRSLANYKSMHKNYAASKGIGTEFDKATTLTQARKILFGFKSKNTR